MKKLLFLMSAFVVSAIISCENPKNSTSDSMSTDTSTQKTDNTMTPKDTSSMPMPADTAKKDSLNR